MQITSRGATSGADVLYRERLTPSLWIMAAAAVLGPMVAMVFVPFAETWALTIGVAVAAAVIVAALAAAPRIEVRDGVLRAGRAHIGVDLLGEAEHVTGQEARELRGPGLDRRAWHLIRGGIDGLVRVPVTDQDDPTSEWVVSSRTPDRLAAAIRRAQAARPQRG